MNNKSFEQESKQSPELQMTNAPDRSKRRSVLLGGGVGAILATVKSGSALAGGTCIAPSAFSSIQVNAQTSNRPKSFAVCSSRGYYGGLGLSDSVLDSRWSPVLRASATLSNTGFSSCTLWPDSSTKLFDIIKPTSTSWDSDANLIVVYLDVMTGKAAGTGVTAADVNDMWKILFGSGTSNLKFAGWDATKVRNFYKVWVGDAVLP